MSEKKQIVSFLGREYPIRTFRVKFDGQEHVYTTSVQSLEDELNEHREDDEAEAIENTIYYYLDDEKIKLPAKEICEKHLDEPMEFIEEIFPV